MALSFDFKELRLGDEPGEMIPQLICSFARGHVRDYGAEKGALVTVYLDGGYAKCSVLHSLVVILTKVVQRGGVGQGARDDLRIEPCLSNGFLDDVGFGDIFALLMSKPAKGSVERIHRL